MNDVEKRLNDLLDAYEEMISWQITVNDSEGDAGACDQADMAMDRFHVLMLATCRARRMEAAPVPPAFVDAIDDLPL
jgi:hypothetical protein